MFQIAVPVSITYSINTPMHVPVQGTKAEAAAVVAEFDLC